MKTLSRHRYCMVSHAAGLDAPTDRRRPQAKILIGAMAYRCSFALIALVTVVAAAPAEARCLLGGKIYDHVSEEDCLEAQRTGCVRSMLSTAQYANCLNENAKANADGRQCIIDGKIHNELSLQECNLEHQRRAIGQ